MLNVTVKSTQNRTRTASTKLTPEEESVLLVRARQAGLPPGVFFRQILLKKEEWPESLRMMMAELRFHRSVQLELLTRALNNEPLSASVIIEIINAAEVQKYVRAEESLEQWRRAKGDAA